MFIVLTSTITARVTLVLFRRRALGEQCGAEQRLGRAFEKAVRRKPLARRTRSLCKLNGARQRCCRWRESARKRRKGPARVWKPESLFENGVVEKAK
jgi:hypothetical protein